MSPSRSLSEMTSSRKLYQATKKRYSYNPSVVAGAATHGFYIMIHFQINIMRRLRHPNVLLFMGAVYSKERLAIITEYMPR